MQAEVVDPSDRKRRAERYARKMKDIVDEKIWAARAKVVATYLVSPSTFPNGPDARAWGYEAWYVPEEWKLNEKGEAVRTVTESTVTTVTEALPLPGNEPTVTETVTGPLSPAEKMRRYRERLKLARETLLRAEKKNVP